ncbi:16S rRNA (cytosine(1402)-N(4))-methyltransferase RsmH [Pontibacter sp. G13]|uniref:16S rRNA (cytosine(1402)-N(4))-methyltransferase RsmH n=1 Tax=Pontibacter sp. G13 TaxID=3074898 RepID=UPI0028897665|nr:16S rRNA (cytosine(1402)-N(4))-methyltransferase RsmH [Pontibacter sp. G13]WNJ20261.1 16S rRNA (cytosine(1402)-N(4))-methyltransferase RsmH [Pontibacter sp. G13]
MSKYHVPVLLMPTVDGLNIKPDGTYVDVTFGGGGHSREILSRLGPSGRLVAFDRDMDAKQNIMDDPRLIFVSRDFQYLEAALLERGIEAVDGILADLGVSSHQFDTGERGFSFRFEGPLDMRMDQRQDLTAAHLLNEWEEMELVHLFSRYGEVTNARKLARTIVQRRVGEPLSDTLQFESVIASCIPPKRRAKYLAQVYQALRIEVNGEMKSLESLLMSGLEMLASGGRMSIISYHSLEDRMVKRFFRAGNFAGKEEKDAYGHSLSPWKLITRRAIQASEEEIEENARARSARLRVAEKK